MKNSELLKALEWRYAVKQFDSEKKISTDDWQALKESLRMAPSSFGLQPWKFIVVKDTELRNTLKSHSWNQSQVVDASHYVVIASHKKVTPEYIKNFINMTAETRGVDASTLEGYMLMMNGFLCKNMDDRALAGWAEKQSYLALGELLFAAATLKIDTCPLEGIDPAKYDELLSLEASDYKTVVAVALGYRHPDDKYQSAAKVRFKESEVFKEI